MRSSETGNRTVRIGVALSLAAAIIGAALIMLLPKNPLFTLAVTIRLIICATIILFFCLMLRFRERKGLFITTSVLFCLLFVTVIGVFSAGYTFYAADLPQYQKNIVIPAVDAPHGNILIAYHPGASSDTHNSAAAFGAALAGGGFNVEIATVNPGFKPDFPRYRMVVLASPVYKQLVRPSVLQFVENNDFTDVEVFTLFTGGHRKRIQEELSHFLPCLKGANAIHAGHFKYTKKLPEDELIQCAKELTAYLN